MEETKKEEEVVKKGWTLIGQAREVQDKITVMLLVDAVVLEGWLLEAKCRRASTLAQPVAVDALINP